MTLFQALLLGLVQGFTEFFPVSSSGHLKLFQHLFGMQELDRYILFDLSCHLGTLGAIFYVLRKELMQFKKHLLFIVLGTLPLFPLLFILKPIKSLFNQPLCWSIGFLLTACILYLGIRKGTIGTKKSKRDALYIGMSQALAIVPGISRSGTTISCARLLGWRPEEALTFSFLLAIPAILGGSFLEVMHEIRTPTASDLNLIHYGIAFLTSLISGTFALIWLRALAIKNRFRYFVWYCGIVGGITLLTFTL